MHRDAQHRADLVGQIYGALLGNGSWEAFVESVSGALPNGKATLFYHDMAARTGAFCLNAGLDAASVEAYSRYYAAKNPWMAKAACRPLDLGVRGEEMLARRELLRSEFYADYLRPLGVDSAVGVTVFREHGCNFMLSVVCRRAEDDKMQAAASLLETLAPHLRQAFAYYRRAGGVASGLFAVEAAAEVLDAAIVSVGLDKRIRWTNGAARRLVALGDPIGLDALGRIATPHGELREAVEAALATATRAEGTCKTTLALPTADPARPPVRATLVAPALTTSERYFAGPCVVLVVETVRPRTLSTEEDLRSAFSLTRSEARFACALADGASVTEVAARQGITRETARTHLKRIFAKMGVGRQAELVTKVHRCQGFRQLPG